MKNRKLICGNCGFNYEPYPKESTENGFVTQWVCSCGHNNKVRREVNENE